MSLDRPSGHIAAGQAMKVLLSRNDEGPSKVGSKDIGHTLEMYILASSVAMKLRQSISLGTCCFKQMVRIVAKIAFCLTHGQR